MATRKTSASPAASPRRRVSRTDGDQTSQRILEAACALFADKGFAETTSKAIAERADVDLASINYHFGSRGGLYQAALVHAHAQLVARRQLEAIDACDKPAQEKLIAFIDTLLNAAFSEQGWPLRLLAREVMSPSSYFSALMTQEIQPKIAILQRILSEALGLPAGHPALLRSLVSIAAPCLMVAVAGGAATPGPVQQVRHGGKQAFAEHLRTFVLAGLAAVSAQYREADAP
ncbi:TetR/AcrR family transcriptional regulator [Diaphorobacter sp.]|uniref:TetR/AcrR family transcriptional regulator n=1 Tax=Diaphorobacter sp. TaxID=1934310 RepID=UPI0028ACFFED|nr:CerR family C-terminal domain-containing protein [Diaphorobacter sp.]